MQKPVGRISQEIKPEREASRQVDIRGGDAKITGMQLRAIVRLNSDRKNNQPRRRLPPFIRMSLNIAEILHGSRFFREVDERSFDRLLRIARIEYFEKGTLIFREHQECPGIYVINTGLVRVFKAANSGKEHTLQLVGPGESFAEVAAIGMNQVPANAEALADSRCVLLPRSQFRRVLEKDHQLCLQMIACLSYRVQHLLGLMSDVVLRDAVARVARYLLSVNGDGTETVELPGLKRHLASHLNLTCETFSRSLRKLVDAGAIVERDGCCVQLMARETLRHIAEGLVMLDEAERGDHELSHGLRGSRMRTRSLQ